LSYLPEGRVRSSFDAWNRRAPRVGDLAFAAVWLALGSGALLALPYNAAAASDSLQRIMLGDPGSAFLRSLHYWSAQTFLVATALHLVEHLARRSETRVRLGLWLRLVLSTVVVVYLMVSGYVLKGDAGGQLARQVLAGLLDRVPLLGPALAALLVGPEESLGLLYVQHAATASLLTLVFIVEHYRRPWPRPAAWLCTLGANATLALTRVPILHDPLGAPTKGPWYMLGLQELLHWLGSPGLAWVPLFAGLALLATLPLLSPVGAIRVKRGLAAALAVYAALVVVGQFLRGEDWRWIPLRGHSAAGFTDWRAFFPDSRAAWTDPPVVLGRREGCLICHADTRGLDPAHSAEAVGCASCHLGQAWTANKSLAHSGMVRVPGNLSVARATCGATACHATVVERVDRSLMARGAGLVGVDRFVFAETPTPDGGGNLRDLGASVADTHLKDLCAGCHLGVEKTGPRRIDELSRGGGCTACHLHDHADPKLHPGLDLRITDDHCFGCHSRSGRIGTSYAGWHEAPGATAAPADGRLLQDGRVFVRRSPDVHHEAGLACVDCHTSREVMGDGRLHAHEQEALEVACDDCHVAGAVRTVGWSELDEESRRIVRSRTGREPKERRFAISGRSGLALVNVFAGDGGRLVLEGKLDGARRPLKPPAAACTAPGHERVSCSACHSAWAPQCLQCHTQRGRDGLWHETGNDFRAERPTLGVRRLAPARIEPFAPGMVLTLGVQPVDSRAFPPALARNGRLERLFAPLEPHTTSRSGRSCASCHRDPLALGLGRGKLLLATERRPRWVFEPLLESLRDGLPADAWTGLLAAPLPRSSTRSDARPFLPEEQRRILRVGACLKCHDPASHEGRRIYGDFAGALARATPRCEIP
jgi:cytochrome b/b6/petB-like protein